MHLGGDERRDHQGSDHAGCRAGRHHPAALQGATTLVDIAPADRAARAWLGREADAIGPEHIGLLAIPLRDRAGDVDGVLSLMSGTVRAGACLPCSFARAACTVRLLMPCFAASFLNAAPFARVTP